MKTQQQRKGSSVDDFRAEFLKNSESIIGGGGGVGGADEGTIDRDKIGRPPGQGHQ